MASAIRAIGAPTMQKRSIRWASSESEWDVHRALISRLYLNENSTLRQIKAEMEQKFSFNATDKMYKSRFKKWAIDMKNNKKAEMSAVMRQHLFYQAFGVLTTERYNVRGRSIELAKVKQFLKRRKIEVTDFPDAHASSFQARDVFKPLVYRGRGKDLEDLEVCDRSEGSTFSSTSEAVALTVSPPCHAGINTSYNRITASLPSSTSFHSQQAGLFFFNLQAYYAAGSDSGNWAICQDNVAEDEDSGKLCCLDNMTFSIVVALLHFSKDHNIEGGERLRLAFIEVEDVLRTDSWMTMESLLNGVLRLYHEGHTTTARLLSQHISKIVCAAWSGASHPSIKIFATLYHLLGTYSHEVLLSAFRSWVDITVAQYELFTRLMWPATRNFFYAAYIVMILNYERLYYSGDTLPSSCLLYDIFSDSMVGTAKQAQASIQTGPRSLATANCHHKLRRGV